LTPLGRALRELGMAWIPAHSPQAKGRVERCFGTLQDRLVKGLRGAGVCTLAQANAYLEHKFLPAWARRFTVAPANPTDAHGPLGRQHNLTALLSVVEARVVERLHVALPGEELADRAGGRQGRVARGEGTGGEAPGRDGGGEVSGSLPEEERMSSGAEAQGRAGHGTHLLHASPDPSPAVPAKLDGRVLPYG
jgi:hypothetical protein